MPKEFEISETRLMEIPDDELDAFIEFARRRIAERALGAAEMSGTSDYIGSAAHSCSLSNLIHRAGLAHEIYSWLCRGLDHRCRRCGPGYVHRRASASSSMIEINAFAFSDISEPQRQ